MLKTTFLSWQHRIGLKIKVNVRWVGVERKNIDELIFALTFFPEFNCQGRKECRWQ